MDTKGERLSKKIPGDFGTMHNILAYVRKNFGDMEKVENWADANFKRDLIAAYGSDSLVRHNVKRTEDPRQMKRYFFMPIDIWMKEASAETKARVYSQYEHIKALAETL